MFYSTEAIDLDWIKSHYCRLYYFGLGFIQLKIDETYRLHFYSDQLPAITEDIHNHRYDFVSTVLKGEITNHLYDLIIPGSTHVIRNESCNPDIKAPQLELACDVVHIESRTMREGESYQMMEHMFHRVEAKDCITLLDRGSYTKAHAQIVTATGTNSVCPFSKKIPDSELWEIIEEMID